MTQATVEIPGEQLEQLLARMNHLEGEIRRRDVGGAPDAEMTQEMNMPARCTPGTAEEEMRTAAEARGGLWHTNAEWRKYATCRHAHPQQCDRCWTPETEARWEFSVGLLEQAPDVGLDNPEAPRSQRANEPTTKAERERTGRVPKT